MAEARDDTAEGHKLCRLMNQTPCGCETRGRSPCLWIATLLANSPDAETAARKEAERIANAIRASEEDEW